jgi:CRISPR-associated endonuclease/helicase Cas3
MMDEAKQVDRVFRGLLQARGPVVPEAEVPSSLQREATGRFAWQDRLMEVATAHDPARGFFAVNMAGTGSGKTIANCKLAAVIRRDGIRFTYCLPTRALTFQTGAAFRDDLGFLDGRHIGVRTGSEALAALADADLDEVLDDNDDEPPMIDQVMLVDDEPDFDQPLRGILKIGTEIASKNETFLQVPILVATVDSLMGVANAQVGRQVHHYLRLLTSDVVIDEVDDFSEEDQAALGRLVHAAGLYGRKVILSSATLPPPTAESMLRAYMDGYRLHCQFMGKQNHSVDVLQKHYDRMSLVRRAAEATPRNYGKREDGAKVVSALEMYG